jgi:hypothetical protein
MKYKLNPDQSMIKKLNDLNPTDRDHYINRLSDQAIKNIVSYVHGSSKWKHTHEEYRDGSAELTTLIDMWTNDHLGVCLYYNHNKSEFSWLTGMDAYMIPYVANGGSTQ